MVSCLALAPAHAAVVRLGATDRPVSVTAGADSHGDIAMRADGSGFVVVYEVSNASGRDIFFKRYDASWQLVQGPVAVNTVIANEQRAPAVDMDGSGNFVVAWESVGQDPGDSSTMTGTYARRFLADGTAIDGAEFRVNTTTTGYQWDADVAVNAEGNFVIVYRSGGSPASILGQSFAGITVGASGNPTRMGGESIVRDASVYNTAALVPAVAIDTSGNYVVTWQSVSEDNPGSNGFDIYLRRMSASGAPLAAQARVNQTVLGNQLQPDIAMADAGTFAVVWESLNIDGSGTAIVMQRYNANGVTVGGEVQVNTGITLNNQFKGRISAAADGRLLVTWTGEEADGDSAGSDVYYKVYNANGAVLTGDSVVSPSTASNDLFEENAVGALTSSGDFVIVFESNPSGFTDLYLAAFGDEPTIAFTSASSSGLESSNAAIGVVRAGRSYALSAINTTAQVTRLSGTATPSVDYTFAPSISFAPGATSASITLNVVDDTAIEDNETIQLGFNSVSGAAQTAPTTHTYTIVDNDVPAISVAGASAVEGNGSTRAFEFSVTLSSVSAQTVTVDYTTQNGTATITDGDYIATAGTLIIEPGVVSAAIGVLVNGDTKPEANETFQVVLANPDAATLATATATGTILNDDTPSVTASTATIARDATSLVIHGASFDPVAANNQVAFDLGVVGTVSAATDTTLTVNLTASPVTSGPLTAIVTTNGVSSGAAVQVATVPLSTLSIVGASMNEGNDGTQELVFLVSLSEASSDAVTVDYAVEDDLATSADGDYVAASGLLVFEAGQTTANIIVVINGDAKAELDETLAVALSNPTGASLATSSAVGTIVNDDTPIVTESTQSIALSATSLVIQGASFDPTFANNTVTFDRGAIGDVTAATASTLTVTFSTRPETPGPLSVVVTTNGVSSGAATQVATVIADPVNGGSDGDGNGNGETPPVSDNDDEGGCSSTRSSSPALAVFMLVLASRSRRASKRQRHA